MNDRSGNDQSNNNSSKNELPKNALELVNGDCEPCNEDTPALTDEEIEILLSSLPDWQVVEREGMSILSRQYRFKNFIQALTFTRGIGDLAERANHHPAILTEWGKVRAEWWTHKVKGLHRNDFIMAARTERLYSERVDE